MKIIRMVCCLCILIFGLMASYPSAIVLAQDEEETEEKIEISPVYPRVEAIAGEDLVFEIEFQYTGEGDRSFELRPTVPKGWESYMTPQWEKERKISAIRLKASFTAGDKIRLVVTAPFFPQPDPGEYPIILEASSGELKDTAELTAVITARYRLVMVPATELYNTEAKAGEDNYLSMEIGNLGTAAVENIQFSSTKPEGWTMEFTPEKIEVLEAFDSQTIDVNIKPPPDAIAGDYRITLRASGAQASTDEVDIRVTVESPTVWGWVGVGIIVVVIVGLVFIFMRFSRR
jgi:uncharacterized membrane protein